MDVLRFLKIFWVSLGLVLLFGCDSDQVWMNESGSAAAVPEDNSIAFERYVSDSRHNIERVLTRTRFTTDESPFIGGYTASEVAAMRAPFQIPERLADLCTEPSQGAGKGFLLIHGLTDSPYILRNMAQSLASAYPCALIRAVLLPGHGTVVGDSLQMKYQDWMAITQFGAESFQTEKSIDQLYVLGFSMGASLAIRHLKDGRSMDKIQGLVLLSAAVQAKSDFAWLTGYIKGVKSWLSEHEERDAARYSSFSSNAGAQFYQLTKGLIDKKYQVNIPVMMAVSADDATINSVAARDFYCNLVSSERKLLIWYQGFSKHELAQCAGILEVAIEAVEQSYQGVKYRFANYAHTAIAGSPADKHYGVNGVYRDCKAYESKGNGAQWDKCVLDTGNRVFGEKNVANISEVLAGGMWRRGTFNKEYEQLSKAVICFVDQSCDLKTLTN